MSKRIEKLFEKLNNNSCSIEELEELKQLLSNKKLSQKYFKEVYENETTCEIDSDISKNLWHAIEKGIDTKPTRKLKNIGFKKLIGIAASIVLIASVILLYSIVNKEKQWVLVQNTTQEVKKIILPDSSYIWLASQSSLSYSPTFNTLKRETKLTGQAFFDVRKNQNIPFTIQTGGLLTRVLGTSFNIKSNDSKVEVAVSTGLVNVSSQNKVLELLPNQKAVYNADVETLEKTNTFGKLHTLWFKDSIIMDRITIKQLIPVLEEKYNKIFVFGDEAAKSATLYSFRLNNQESLDQLIKRINFINEVQLKLNNSMIEITTKK